VPGGAVEVKPAQEETPDKGPQPLLGSTRIGETVADRILPPAGSDYVDYDFFEEMVLALEVVVDGGDVRVCLPADVPDGCLFVPLLGEQLSGRFNQPVPAPAGLPAPMILRISFRCSKQLFEFPQNSCKGRFPGNTCHIGPSGAI
jgi:hypothetical protein